MPATLNIWPNETGLAAAGTPGHASLEVLHNGRRDYISWWPTGDGKAKPFNTRQAAPKTWEQDMYAEMAAETRQRLDAGTFQPRAGQVQQEFLIEGVRRNVWVQRPTFRIQINGAGEGDPGIGLNLERMCEWWEVFRRTPTPQYQFVSRTMNCASVVGSALIAGGGQLFTPEKLNDMSHGWHTPRDVMGFAEKINRGIRNLEEHVRFMRIQQPLYHANQMPLMARQQMTPLNWNGSMTRNNRNEDDLMTFQAWIALSDRNIKTFLGYARRRDQVAKIDTMLQEYHRNQWTGVLWPTKVQLLMNMLEQVHEHMREKPNSDRGEAVFVLGKQLVAVLDVYGNAV